MTAIRSAFEMPILDAAVTQIYPSGDVLPEKILRFYINFVTPKKPHVALNYIGLREA